jgi:hypothetical protein
VSDGDGDDLYSSPIFLEGHDEREVFLGLLRKFGIAAEVSA